jgi:hypothetical protein
MNPMNLVYSNTTKFIIPMLFSDSTHNEVLNKYFIDSYSFDYYEPNYDNKIIIVMNINEAPKTDFSPIDTYKRQNQYCFVYEVPLEFKDDYEYILKGKYHLISEKYHERLLHFWEEVDMFTIKYNFIRELYRVTA